MTYAELILSDAPVAYWHLDEATSTGTGSDVADATGHGYTGQNFMLPGAGQPGAFSGSNTAWGGDGRFSVAVAGGASLPHGGAPFSYEAWIKPIDNFGGSGHLAGNAIVDVWDTGTGGRHSRTRVQWWDTSFGEGAYVLELSNIDNNTLPEGGTTVWAPTSDLRGSWHHVCVTWDGALLIFYLDGAPLSLAPDTSPEDIAPVGLAFRATAAYIGGAAPASGNNSWCGVIDEVAVYDYALSACQALSHYDLATTGSYVPCVPWVRLSHSSGQGYWQSRGDMTEEWAGGARRLLLPLPSLSVTPDLLVGKDPDTSLPAFCPAPHVVQQIIKNYTDKVTIDNGGQPETVTCVQVKCGAAAGMVDNMQKWYNFFQIVLRQLLNWLGDALAGLVIDTVSAFIDALTDGAGLVLTPLEEDLIVTIAENMPALTGTVLSTLVSNLGLDALEYLKHSAFCCITCSGNQVRLDQAQMQAWQSTIAGAPSGHFTGLQKDVCAAIALWGADFPDALVGWASAANLGANSPSLDCDFYTCPAT